MRYELTDHEWAAIKPMLPNKPRGVARVNDRRVLNLLGFAVRGTLAGPAGAQAYRKLSSRPQQCGDRAQFRDQE